jgi:hypothetical protein
MQQMQQMLSRKRTHAVPFSFIRTMTVGPGIKPGLLTFVFRHAFRGKPRAKHKALAGYAQKLCAITAGGEFHPAPRTCS